MPYLFDVLFTLPPKIFVRISFAGSSGTFCFTTGKRNTETNVRKIRDAGIDGVRVREMIPLWHAQELYIRCVE